MASKQKIDGEDEACKTGYVTRVPLLFLRDDRLTNGAKVLMVYMTRYATMRDGKVRPSQSRLAEELGTDLRTVNRWMAELKGLGYVRVVKQGRNEGEPNVYELSWWPCLEVAVQDGGGEDVGADDPTSLALEEEAVRVDAAEQVGEAESVAEEVVPVTGPLPQQDTPAPTWDKAAVEALMRSITIPPNLQESYPAIHSAVGKKIAALDPAPAMERAQEALVKALSEVAGMVDGGLVDERGPAGLIASKVATYCQVGERDFEADAIQVRYAASQKACSEEERGRLGLRRRYVMTATQKIETEGMAAVEAWMESQWYAVPRYLFLMRHSRPIPDGLLDEAGGEWTFSNQEVRAFYRGLFADVDVTELEDYRKRYLAEHGLADMDDAVEST